MLKLQQNHTLMVKSTWASLNISAQAVSSPGKCPPYTPCLICRDWESSSRNHLVQFSTARPKSILSQEGQIARWWTKGSWKLSMTGWKATINNKQTKQCNNKKATKNPTHPKTLKSPLKGSTKVCHTFPLERGDLQPQQIHIHHFQPPLWAVCPYHHTRAGSAVPNNLDHLKQPIEQWYRRSQQPDYWRSMRLLFQTRSPDTEQIPSTSGEPRELWECSLWFCFR